jgi:hypothetical protein
MSRRSFPRATTRTIPGQGVYSYPPHGDLPGSNSIDDKTSSVIQSYDDSTGGSTPGWPTVRRNNDYFRIHYESMIEAASVTGGTDNGETYSATWPCNTLIGGNGAGFDFHLQDGANACSTVAGLVLNKLASEVKDQKVNLAQVFAERRQTSDLIVSTIRRLVSSISSLRRGNIVGAVTALTGSRNRLGKVTRVTGVKRVAGGIPENWLALQYGWKPLLSDVYGSIEELNRSMTEGKPLLSAQASARFNLPRVEHAFGLPDNFFPEGIQFRSSGYASGRGVFVYSVDSTLASAMTRVGVADPLTLAWELLPWSFVVDWFLPIGNYISNLNYSNGLTFHSGYISTKASDTWTTSTTRSSGKTGPLTLSWSNVRIGSQTNTFRRFAFYDFPSVTLPRFKDPFSPTHVANALSLLATAFRHR